MSNALFLYLDPGTGSLLLYAILGVCTTLLFLVKELYYKTKQFFVGKNDNTLLMKEYDIVIHSEGGRYFNVFNSIINEFINNKVKIVYVTPDKDDPVYNIKNEYLEIISFLDEYKELTFLNTIKCNILLSTTPHLDVYMWKKSKNVKKYVHVFHAPTSIDLYEKYALSYYDVIICSVDKTIETQKYLDKKRNLPQKDFYVGGCTYYDVMLQNQELKNTIDPDTILYAPSWGIRSSLNTCGISIIQRLLEENFKVIFRPHPQSFISDRNVLDEIVNKFGANSNFVLDKNKSGLASMAKAALLISDFSGIVFDYYYLFNRPVYLASKNVNINGYEVEDIPVEYQYDIPVTESIAYKLNEEDVNNICELIKNKINSEFTKIELPYFSISGKRVFEILMEIKGTI